jgi:hypothetical protein
VRDAACKAPDALEALRVLELRGDSFLLRDVADDGGDADNGARGVEDRRSADRDVDERSVASQAYTFERVLALALRRKLEALAHLDEPVGRREQLR